MGRHEGAEETIRREGPSEFAFLVDEWGFLGPERTDDGLAYHRSGLHISIGFWAWKNEQGFDTRLSTVDRDGKERSASLTDLYVACGLGPPQAVPEGASSGSHHLIVKRLQQHPSALRALLPHIQGPEAQQLWTSS